MLSVYPNPSSARSTIEFSVAKKGRVKLEMYDGTGRIVKVLADATMEKGRYKKLISSSTNGIFTYRLQLDGKIETGKLIIQK